MEFIPGLRKDQIDGQIVDFYVARRFLSKEEFKTYVRGVIKGIDYFRQSTLHHTRVSKIPYGEIIQNLTDDAYIRLYGTFNLLRRDYGVSLSEALINEIMKKMHLRIDVH
jgi:hypothetical protein